MNSQRNRYQSGSSLIEVMVAMFILAVGVLGLIPLIGLTIYNNTLSFDLTDYNAMAQRQVEALVRQADYGNLPLILTETAADSSYTMVTKVHDNTSLGSVPAGVHRISVDISWPDKQGLTRSVSYVTLKAQ